MQPTAGLATKGSKLSSEALSLNPHVESLKPSKTALVADMAQKLREEGR